MNCRQGVATADLTFSIPLYMADMFEGESNEFGNSPFACSKHTDARIRIAPIFLLSQWNILEQLTKRYFITFYLITFHFGV